MREVHDLDEAKRFLTQEPLQEVVFQNIDLRAESAALKSAKVDGTIFLGCQLPPNAIANMVAEGAVVFPNLSLPWNTYRTSLYSVAEVFDGFDFNKPCSYCDTFDARVWRHWRDNGGAHPTHAIETLARTLHDHAIYQSMNRLLESQEKVVAIMGGHSMMRDAPEYAKVALMSKRLAERGYFLTSGGGPGAMEATHLGAWFTNKPESELHDAVSILAKAPLYKDRDFLSQAFRVREKYPYENSCAQSLGIPTWLYGHEPPNPFATHIAKFFANSVREDGLVSIATHGIVFAPGSAGTIQEIFQDAAQNHYATVKGCVSPMVFLDENFWRNDKPVYELVKNMSVGRPYAELLTIGDDIDTLIAFIEAHPPLAVDGAGWNVCGLHCDQ